MVQFINLLFVGSYIQVHRATVWSSLPLCWTKNSPGRDISILSEAAGHLYRDQVTW